MVDRDKIRDRLNNKKGSSGGKSKKRRSGSSKDKSGGGSDSVIDSKDSSVPKKEDNIGSVGSRSDVPKSHIKEALMAIANSLLYAEGKSRAVEEAENSREKYSKAAADNMYEQYADIASQYEVQLIAEKYGFDWEDDIIVEVLKEQDYTDKVGV